MTFLSPLYIWPPHPWQVLVGKNDSKNVSGCIEITPFDFIKSEVENVTIYQEINRQ